MNNNSEISLREEQLKAINLTYDYWQNEKNPSLRKYLWNAKPRFGKTIAAYFFAQKISARRILIVTNRPSISDSWAQDFYRYIQPKSDFIFAASRPEDITVGGKQKHIYSRAELIDNYAIINKPLIYFSSLQDLKGKENCNYKKTNRWIFDIKHPWDLLIVDEGHEGVKTSKTDEVLKQISVDFTLYLSGTPFRAIADGDFSGKQIFNWSYLDEQRAKQLHCNKKDSPYSLLPKLQFDLYYSLDERDHAANLNELFEIKNHSFAHEAKIKTLLQKIADVLRPQSDSIDYRHSLWMLSGAEECRLLEKLLVSNQSFLNYKVILAVGKNDPRMKQNSVLKKVRKSINDSPLTTKTITLSCQQLTTGVTIPEWSTIVMLRSSNDVLRMSSTQYIQTVFRAQSPWGDLDGHRKDKCRVIDFLPSRAIAAVKDYSDNLCINSSETSGDELMDYVDIFLHKNSGTQHLEKKDFKSLANEVIGQDVVNEKFLNINKLCNAFKIEELSDDVISIINRLDEIYKQRVRKNTQPILSNQVFSHREIKTLDGAHSTRQRKLDHADSPTELIRNRLRSATSAIPLLLHYSLGSENNPELTLSSIQDDAFRYFLKISKSDFMLLSSSIFNQEKLAAAISEFTKRERACATYYKDQGANIFNYLAPIGKSENYTLIRTAEIIVNRISAFRPELFCSETTKLFDPYTKSGNLLSAMIAMLYKNLRSNFSSDHDCLYHILSQQVYSWSPNKYLQKVALNNILNMHLFQFVNFTDNELENIKRNFTVFVPLDHKTKFTGGNNMKFDVILSNPPYQIARRQVYADFYRLCVDLNPDILCMIFPMGWQKPQNHNGLGQLNNARYKRDIHLVSIDNYDAKDSQLLFPRVGTGGVNIVLRDRLHDNHGKIQKLIAGRPSGDMILPLSSSEIPKPLELKRLSSLVAPEPKISSLGSARSPYGFNADALRDSDKYLLTTFRKRINRSDLRLFGLMRDGKRGYKFIPRGQVKKTNPNLDNFKLFVPKAWGNMSEKIGLGGSYANVCVAGPNDCCTETFIEFAPFETQDEATKMAKYFMTKFFRALLFLAKESQNTTRDKYRYIPLPDLSDEMFNLPISQVDSHLFDKYHVPLKTRKFIVESIQTRDESNIEVL